MIFVLVSVLFLPEGSCSDYDTMILSSAGSCSDYGTVFSLPAGSWH